MPTNEPVSFFMVWTKRGWAPRKQHATRAAAEAEAARLAGLHPGQKFIVLEAVAKIAEPEAKAA